jgi:hypothetical protein
MYVQFELLVKNTIKPVNLITTLLDLWAQQYQIKYKTKFFKDTLRVTFDDDRHYTIFAMTWNPEHNSLLDYSLIEPMNRV